MGSLSGTLTPVYIPAEAEASPDSISGLTLWLKANGIVGSADNDPVTTWYDQAAGGTYGDGLALTQATSGNRPIYNTAVVNGLPVVTFDGTDDNLAATGVTGSTLFSTGPNTIFVVQRQPTPGATGSCLTWEGGAPGANRVNLHLAYSGTLYYDYGDNTAGGRISVAQPAGWNTGFHITEVHRPAASGDGQIVVDGTVLTEQTFTDALDNTVSAALTVGAGFGGDLAEIAVYNRQLTEGERLSVRTHLATKYAISLTAPEPAAVAMEEFHGPFTSWRNAVTADGATGNGTTDDTAALQAWLDNATASKYLPPGDYRITAALTLTDRRGVRIIGDDPTTTRIFWDGSAGDDDDDAPVFRDLLRTNGVSYSSISRITLDGMSTAGAVGINMAWDGAQPTADTGNEVVDCILQDLCHGVRIGTLGFMGSELSLRRCEFLRCAPGAGVGTYNYNALDIWVSDCLFEDCYVAVTNEGHGHGKHPQGGNYHVYRCVFRGSLWSALSFCNTSNTFSVRDSVSYQDNSFLHACGIGAPGAPVTVQRCQILDPVGNLTADRTSNFNVKTWRACIEMGNPGPLLVVDSTFRMPGTWDAGSMVVLHVAQEFSGDPTADVTFIGNTFGDNSGFSYGVQGDLVDTGNIVVALASIATPDAATAGITHAPKVVRTVLEPSAFTSAAIQTQIDTATTTYLGIRPVVHLPAGTYTMSAEATVPAGADVQIEGDGYDTGGTVLAHGGSAGMYQLHLIGPGSRAVVRDLKISGATSAGNGIRLTLADQEGGRVVCDQVASFNGTIGTDVNGLDNTVVRFDGCQMHPTDGAGGVCSSVTGGPVLAAGGAGDGGLLCLGYAAGGANLPFQVASGGQVGVLDGWWESGTFGTFLAPASGARGRVSLNGYNLQPQHIATSESNVDVLLSGFVGDVLFSSCVFYSNGKRQVMGAGSATRFLLLNTLERENTSGVYLENTATGTPQISRFQSKLALWSGWTAPVADAHTNVSDPTAFAVSLLAPIRDAETSVPPSGVQGAPSWASVPEVPAGATDVWLSRVFIDAAATGLRVQRT